MTTVNMFNAHTLTNAGAWVERMKRAKRWSKVTLLLVPLAFLGCANEPTKKTSVPAPFTSSAAKPSDSSGPPKQSPIETPSATKTVDISGGTVVQPSKPAANLQAPAAPIQSACSATYTINVTVVLSSTFTRGENRVKVELRQGSPGTSKVFDTQSFEGQTGTISFSRICAGSYFIAIGNGDSVAVGPVRQITQSQNVRSTVRVTPSSGNVGTRSRGSL